MATFKQIDFLAGGVSNASNQQLIGGSATIYLSGTNELAVLKKDADGVEDCPNPVILNATGSASIFVDGIVDVVLKDANGLTVANYNGFTYEIPDQSNFGIDASQFGNGNDAEAIQLAIDSVAGSPAQIFLVAQEWIINQNLTIPTNINILFVYGAYMDIQTGFTLNYQGTWTPILYPIHTGLGSLIYSTRNNTIPSVNELNGTYDNQKLTGTVNVDGKINVVNGSGINTTGSINIGDNNDGALYSDGTNAQLITTNNAGIVLDSDSDKIDLKASSVSVATVEIDGIDLVVGNTYQVNNVPKLSETQLTLPVLTIGDNSIDSTNNAIEFKATGATLGTIDLDGLNLTTGLTYQINDIPLLSETELTLPNLTIGNNSIVSVDATDLTITANTGQSVDIEGVLFQDGSLNTLNTQNTMTVDLAADGDFAVFQRSSLNALTIGTSSLNEVKLISENNRDINIEPSTGILRLLNEIPTLVLENTTSSVGATPTIEFSTGTGKIAEIEGEKRGNTYGWLNLRTVNSSSQLRTGITITDAQVVNMAYQPRLLVYNPSNTVFPGGSTQNIIWQSVSNSSNVSWSSPSADATIVANAGGIYYFEARIELDSSTTTTLRIRNNGSTIVEENSGFINKVSIIAKVDSGDLIQVQLTNISTGRTLLTGPLETYFNMVKIA